MALIDSSDQSWWNYAVEFARRGLWPMREIETHGPHSPPADRVWGETFCATSDRDYYQVSFVGPSGCRHYSDIHGLRMQAAEDETIRFPILLVAERNQRVRSWLRYAKKRARIDGKERK